MTLVGFKNEDAPKGSAVPKHLSSCPEISNTLQGNVGRSSSMQGCTNMKYTAQGNFPGRRSSMQGCTVHKCEVYCREILQGAGVVYMQGSSQTRPGRLPLCSCIFSPHRSCVFLSFCVCICVCICICAANLARSSPPAAVYLPLCLHLGRTGQAFVGWSAQHREDGKGVFPFQRYFSWQKIFPLQKYFSWQNIFPLQKLWQAGLADKASANTGK